MPRRNKRKAKGAEPGTLGAGGGKGGPGENWGGEHMRQAPTPLIAVNPDRTLIAVAFGTEVRVYDTETGALATLASVCAFDAAAAAAREGGAEAPDASRWHTDAIRALRFDSTGASMCTAGDDKLARVWRVEKADVTTPASAGVVPSPRTLTCVRCARLPKKACAAAFFSAADGAVAAFADKFGDVHGLPVTETQFKGGEDKTTFDEATYLLGHCCSIITDACAVTGETKRLLATADRDFKIRVARLPDTTSTILNPEIGVPEIQSFCHGHAAFVACVAAVPSNVGDAYVVSGGGDGAAKLWRCEDGEEAGSVTLAPPRPKKVEESPAGDDDDDGDDEKGVSEKGKAHVVMNSGEAPREAVDAPAVVAIAVAKNGDVYASVEERDGHVAKLRVETRRQGASASDDSRRLSLELVEWVDLRGAGVEGVPSSLHYDETSKELVGVCERKCARRDGDDGATTEAAVFFALGGVDAADASFDRARCSRALAVAGMAEASTGVSLGDAMRKRSYDEQRREERKKQRNDFKSGGASLSNL